LLEPVEFVIEFLNARNAQYEKVFIPFKNPAQFWLIKEKELVLMKAGRVETVSILFLR